MVGRPVYCPPYAVVVAAATNLFSFICCFFSSLSLSALHRTWQRGLEKGGGGQGGRRVYLGTVKFQGKKGRETFVEAMFGSSNDP